MSSLCSICSRWYDYVVGAGPHCSARCREAALAAPSPPAAAPLAVGDRVRISRRWSNYGGQIGRVDQVGQDDLVVVALPGVGALRFGAAELEVIGG